MRSNVKVGRGCIVTRKGQRPSMADLYDRQEFNANAAAADPRRSSPNVNKGGLDNGDRRGYSR